MALNCRITKGIQDSCSPSVAGVNRLWIANWDDSYVFTASQGNCEIDTIDMGQEKVYSLAIADGTGVATATGTQGGNASSKYYQHSVGGTIMKLDCDLLGDYNNYFLGKFIVFVETKNREVFAFGVDNGLSASTFEYTSGTAEGDAAGVSFVFEGSQPSAPLKIKDVAVIKALVQA